MRNERWGWRPPEKPRRERFVRKTPYHWVDNQEYREQIRRRLFVDDTEKKYRIGQPRLADHFERRGGHDFENFFVYLAEKWFPGLVVKLASLEDDQDHTDTIIALENPEDIDNSFCLAIDITINQDPIKLREKLNRVGNHTRKQIRHLCPEIIKRDVIPMVLGIDSHNAGQLMHKLYMAYDGIKDPRFELSLDPQFQDLYIEILQEIINELYSTWHNNCGETKSTFMKNVEMALAFFDKMIKKERETRKRMGRNPRISDIGNSFIVQRIINSF